MARFYARHACLLPAVALLLSAGMQPAAARPGTAIQQVSREAIERRERTTARLTGEDVATNPGLPLIEDSRSARRATLEEIVTRALALLVVSMKGSGASEEDYRAIERKFALREAYTPEERSFIDDPAPDARTSVQFSWRFEAACALLWAAGRVESMGAPRTECPVEQVAAVLRAPDRAAVVAASDLRPIGEILDEADLIYSYRWAIVDEQVGGEPVPEWLNDDIAMERHWAFNWLIISPVEPWDEISLDT